MKALFRIFRSITILIYDQFMGWCYVGFRWSNSPRILRWTVAGCLAAIVAAFGYAAWVVFVAPALPPNALLIFIGGLGGVLAAAVISARKWIAQLPQNIRAAVRLRSLTRRDGVEL